MLFELGSREPCSNGEIESEVSASRFYRVVSLQRMTSFQARWLVLVGGQEERLAFGGVLTDQACIRRAWIVAAPLDSSPWESPFTRPRRRQLEAG